jgi:RimJ/RimL family protein N-acetyltransferase
MPDSPPETIKLAAGVLTRIRATDGDDIARAVGASLDHLRPWMPWATEAAAQPEAQRERGRQAEAVWEAGSDFIYVLRPDEAGPVIGNFGLHSRVGPGALEIGYWMHAGYVRQGYATAAAAALTETALALPGIDRVEIHTDEANTASAAIPARLGYRQERTDTRPPEAPSESGRLQIWVTDAKTSGHNASNPLTVSRTLLPSSGQGLSR